MDSSNIDIICARIKMGVAPHVHCRVKNCDECLHPIWVADSTPDMKGARYLCMQCADWKNAIGILPPTQEQKDQIASWQDDQMSDELRSKNKR